MRILRQTVRHVVESEDPPASAHWRKAVRLPPVRCDVQTEGPSPQASLLRPPKRHLRCRQRRGQWTFQLLLLQSDVRIIARVDTAFVRTAQQSLAQQESTRMTTHNREPSNGYRHRTISRWNRQLLRLFEWWPCEPTGIDSEPFLSLKLVWKIVGIRIAMSVQVNIEKFQADFFEISPGALADLYQIPCHLWSFAFLFWQLSDSQFTSCRMTPTSELRT